VLQANANGDEAMQTPYRTFAIVIAINTIILFLLAYTLIGVAGFFGREIDTVQLSMITLTAMAALIFLFIRTMHPNKVGDRRMANAEVRIRVPVTKP
jgi:hypothetical protein